MAFHLKSSTVKPTQYRCSIVFRPLAPEPAIIRNTYAIYAYCMTYEKEQYFITSHSHKKKEESLRSSPMYVKQFEFQLTYACLLHDKCEIIRTGLNN